MKSILKKVFYLLLFSATVLQLEAQENHITRPDFYLGNEHQNSVIRETEMMPNVRSIKELNENSDSFDLDTDGRGDAKVVYQSKTLSKKDGSNAPIRDSIVYYDYTDKTLLDSVRYSKRYYTAYDANGNNTIQNYYKWIEGVWVISIVWENKYDSNNNNTFYSKKIYSEDSKSWVWVNKQISEYDANNNQTLSESYNWDADNNDWVGDTKHVTLYDANNNLIQIITDGWDTGNNVWENLWNTYRVYDGNNNHTQSTSYVWDNNDWVEHTKGVYSYDTNNNRILALGYSWDRNINSWKAPFSKTIFTYDINNNFTQYEYYSWDTDNNVWEGYTKRVNTYDTNNNNILVEGYDWNTDNNIWEATSKTVYAYDVSNNKVIEEYYSWDTSNNEWIGDNKYVNSVTKSGIDYYFIHCTWDLDTKSWYATYSVNYYYDGNILSNNKIQFSDSYNIFPNPISAKNILTVNTKNNENFTYKIFTSNGKLVLQGTSSTRQKNIDVSSLEKGIYMLQIINKDGALSSKFIK